MKASSHATLMEEYIGEVEEALAKYQVYRQILCYFERSDITVHMPAFFDDGHSQDGLRASRKCEAKLLFLLSMLTDCSTLDRIMVRTHFRKFSPSTPI